jgi:2-octaprenyl-6-methoxyphenol hydroxylase
MIDAQYQYDYDLIIIGGGPVGMALALALRNSGLSVLLLEARGLPEKAEDPRPLALSQGSRLVLQRLGVWKTLSDVTPIFTIHVSNQGGLGRTVMMAREIGVPALGYVVSYDDVFRAMHKVLQKCEMDYLTGAQVTHMETSDRFGRVEFEHEGITKKTTARLLVVADGGRLIAQIEGITQQVHDYEQWAIVARVKTEHFEEHLAEQVFGTELSDTKSTFARVRTRPGMRFSHAKAAEDAPGGHQPGVAYERFTPEGPVALLPAGDGFALVWTVSPDRAQEILGLDDAAFLERLHGHFGDRLGRFIEAGKRSGFPLTLKYATPVTASRTVLIGNAAQTLHPVAGQGFNLGLRDAWELAEEIVAFPAETGTPAMLARYSSKRRLDSNMGRTFTDSLVKLFSNDNPFLSTVRGAGLSALDCLPQLKKFVARRMMFGARG